jgi:hypothetical protein
VGDLPEKTPKTFSVTCTAENLFFHGATFLGKSVWFGMLVLSASERVDLVAWSVLTKSLGRAVRCFLVALVRCPLVGV